MSEDRALEALVEEAGEAAGERLVKSPAVGIYGGAPEVGEVLVAGSSAGRLRILGSTARLVMPGGAAGRVAERLQRNRRDPVAYGQVLLRLLPVEAGSSGLEQPSAVDPTVSGLPEGTFAVVSPTHGMFYRRPSPESPPYVDEGQVVEQGATLALVEVMKCFSAIAYGGPGLPSRARVVEIRAEDGAEVQADQVLFVVAVV